MSVATSRHLRVDNGTHQASARAGTSSGKEYATVYVAASNSHQDAKDTADYVCDGVYDEEQINQAIQDVWDVYFAAENATSGTSDVTQPGGRVILAEGTYIIDTFGLFGAMQSFGGGPAGVGNWPPLILQGQGPGTVLLRGDTKGFDILFTYIFGGVWGTETVVFRDLVFDGGPYNGLYCPVYAQSHNIVFERCTFRNLVRQNWGQVEMTNTVSASFYDCHWEAPGYSGSYHVYIAVEDNKAIVDGCTFGPGAYTAIYIAASGATITNNYIENTVGVGGNQIDRGFDSLITGNIIVGGDIGIGAFPGSLILNNTVVNAGRHGIYVNASNETVIVSGNLVSGCGWHGIYLAGNDNLQCTGNLVYGCGQDTDNTWDGIAVGDSGLGSQGHFNVQGNTVRHGGGANRHKYGIDVLGGTAHFVTNNDLKDSGRTASFHDAGSATVTSAGNRL